MDDTPTEPSPDRHSIARWLLAAFALVVVGVAAIVVIAIVRSSSVHGSRVVILPDGTRIEALGCVTGTNSFTSEKPWERIARKFLPAKYQDWIPQPVVSRGGT